MREVTLLVRGLKNMPRMRLKYEDLAFPDGDSDLPNWEGAVGPLEPQRYHMSTDPTNLRSATRFR